MPDFRSPRALHVLGIVVLRWCFVAFCIGLLGGFFIGRATACGDPSVIRQLQQQQIEQQLLLSGKWARS